MTEGRRVIPVEDYVEPLRHLLVLQREMTKGGMEVPAGHVNAAPMVHGWSAQARRLGLGVLRLRSARLVPESGVLVRCMIEYAVRSHWLAGQGDSGVPAALKQQQDAVRTLIDDATGGPIDVSRLSDVLEWELDSLKGDWPSLQTLLDRMGRRSDIYVMYRALSATAHPTVAGAMAYVHVAEDGSLLGVRDNPIDLGTADDPVGMATHCMVWTLDALNRCLHRRPYSEQLLVIANSINCQPSLSPSP